MEHWVTQYDRHATRKRSPESFRLRTERWSTPLVVGAVALGLVSGCDRSKPKEKQESSSKVAIPTKLEEQKPASSMMDSMNLPTMGEMDIPKDNPQSPEKIELGRKLFFDKRLSVDGSVSCYSCHQDEQGGGGKDPVAIGAESKKLTRHSPVIWNVGYLPALYWDGRADSLEAQAKGAWGGGNMGVGKENLDKKAAEIAAMPEYQQSFKSVFGNEKITAEQVVGAISSFERTLVCKDTAYDKYAAGDKDALTTEQKTGMELFLGKGMCTACHSPPFFSAAYVGKGAYFNVGVGIEGVPEDEVDIGRMKVTEKEQDWAAFKVPTLRNVTKTAPYFHDGSAATLKEAVSFMAGGGYDNKNKNPLMMDKKLSEEEIDSIITFLSALDCPGKVEVASK